MKTPRIAILLLVTAAVCQPGFAQTPDVQQLLRDVQARYASLQSYSATGEVRGGITSDGALTTRHGTQRIRRKDMGAAIAAALFFRGSGLTKGCVDEQAGGDGGGCSAGTVFGKLIFSQWRSR